MTELLFIGGPLDGQIIDFDPPLTETIGYVGDGEFTRDYRYEPEVRPYFLHTVLAESGPVPLYGTTPDFHEFADQLAAWRPPLQSRIDPAALPAPADSTVEMTVWIPRDKD